MALEKKIGSNRFRPFNHYSQSKVTRRRFDAVKSLTIILDDKHDLFKCACKAETHLAGLRMFEDIVQTLLGYPAEGILDFNRQFTGIVHFNP